MRSISLLESCAAVNCLPLDVSFTMFDGLCCLLSSILPFLLGRCQLQCCCNIIIIHKKIKIIIIIIIIIINFEKKIAIVILWSTIMRSNVMSWSEIIKLTLWLSVYNPCQSDSYILSTAKYITYWTKPFIIWGIDYCTIQYTILYSLFG